MQTVDNMDIQAKSAARLEFCNYPFQVANRGASTTATLFKIRKTKTMNSTQINLHCDEAYSIKLIDGTFHSCVVFQGFAFDTQRGPIACFSWYNDESGQSGDLELVPGAIASVELYRS